MIAERKAVALPATCLTLLLVLATARPAAGDIRLGDETISNDRFIVYLFIGHSNMDGQAKRRINPPHPRAWRYDTGGRRWIQARDDGSPVMPFLRTMCEQYPEYHFGAIKVSVSAARIHQRYRKGCGHYNALIAAARRETPRCTLAGILAMIGFAEAGNRTEAEGFLDQARGMMGEIREDLREPELPLLIGKYEEGATNLRGFRDVVLKAIYRIPEEIPHSVVIDKDGPYVDGHHYNAEGHRIWAEEAAKLVGRHRLFPFAPPVQVKLTAPEENRIVKEGDVTLTAEAESEEGKIAAVTFFANGEEIGADSEAPFEWVWTSPPEGLHHLKAAARDSKDNTAESVSVPMAVGDVPSVLFVPGSTSLASAEMRVRRRLEGMGYLVEVVSDDDATPETAKGRAAVLIPASCHGLAVRKFRHAAAPVVIWNDYCPELRVVPRSGGAVSSGVDTLAVLDAKHPLSGGLEGPVRVFDEPQRVRWVRPGGSANVAATLAGEADKAALFAYESGAILPRIGRPAPNRRVSMFMGYFATSHFTEDGWKLFDAAVRWAVEGEPLPSPGETTEESDFDEWPADRDRLAFLWEHNQAANRVEKLTGKGTRVCEVVPHGRATFDRLFRMDAAGGRFLAPQMDEPLAAACKRTHQFSVEVVITPEARHADWSRIFSYDAGNDECNVVLGQHRKWIYFRLRTDRTLKEGAAGTLCRIDPCRTNHLVFTCGNGEAKAYVNGERMGTVFRYKGNLSTWEPQKVVFGDSSAGGFGWNGRIEGVCLYARTLRPAEVAQRWELYKPRLEDEKRAPPPRTVLNGKLLTTSAPAEPPEAYRRSLVVCEYEVEKVLAGECDAERVLVAHWATLDGKPLERTRGRKVGRSYRLILEPFDAHPEIGSEERNDETGRMDLPLYYDVQR